MRRLIVTSAAAALLLGLTGAAIAGGPHMRRIHGPAGAGHGDMMVRIGEHLAEELDLTEEQRAAAKQLHEELAAKAEPLHEKHRQQFEEIHGLLDAGNADATALGQRMIAAHATRKEIRAIHEQGMERFAALLTEEQRERFEEIRSRHRDGHKMKFHMSF